MKIIKPLLVSSVIGAAAFSTTYIIVNETKAVTQELDSKYNTINQSFKTLSSAFEDHVSEHLEDDDLDQIYDVIEKNFSTLSDSISDSKNDLVKYFQDEIQSSVDSLSKTIIDKTSTLDQKIVTTSEEVERLSGKFIDIEQTQKEISADLENFRISYEAAQAQLQKDITLFKNEITTIKTKADLTDKEIQNIHGLIEKINEDFATVDEIRQSVKSLENKLESAIAYLESVSKITTNNSYEIEKLKDNITLLQTSMNNFEVKVKNIESNIEDNSNKIISLNNKYEALHLSFELNMANVNTSITDLKDSLTILENGQTANTTAILNIDKSLIDLKDKFNHVLISNEALKSDIEELYTSTADIYKGLLELQEGFKELQDKYNDVPTIFVVDEQHEISSNQLPTIQLPELDKLKSLSLFLKVDAQHGSEVVNVNILNAFYTTSESFTGSVSLQSGNEYLIKAKLNKESISVSGFWSRRGNGIWKSLSHGERSKFYISKLIAIY